MSNNDDASGGDDFYGVGRGSPRQRSRMYFSVFLMVVGLFFVGVGGGMWYVRSQVADVVSFNRNDNNNDDRNADENNEVNAGDEDENADDDINVDESATPEATHTQVGSVTGIMTPFTPALMPPTATSPPEGSRIGFTAPDFSLQSLDGETITLSSYRGKAVLINLWTSWCGPCLSEMPAIQKSYEIYGDEGYAVIAVNLIYSDSMSDVESYIESEEFTFPIVSDDTRFFRDNYDYIGSIPTSYFIDRYGVIQFIQIGSMNEDWLFENVENLLAIN